jgi:hypothetical protein
MVKFKVSFTIEAKTLFQILSKTLPIEDLKVEEQVGQDKLAPLAKQFAQTKLTKQEHKKHTRSRPSVPFNPDKGINKIILAALTQRPYRVAELRSALASNGYSPNSTVSRLTELRAHGAVTKQGNGLWGLVSQSETKLQEA